MTVTRTSPAAIARRIALRRDRTGATPAAPDPTPHSSVAATSAPAGTGTPTSTLPAFSPSDAELLAAGLLADDDAAGPVNLSKWRRKSFVVPASEARAIVSAWLDRYPQARWRSEIENWRIVGDDLVQLTMRRLPQADSSARL